MRRIISQLFVLLDGVMKAPEEWHFPYYDNWMAEVVAEQIDGADILLLGRATYQIFAGSWPHGAARCRRPPGSTQCRSWWSRPR
jgi:dihydrofolate reductase